MFIILFMCLYYSREHCIDGPFTEDAWFQACTESSCDNTQDLIIEESVYSMVNKVLTYWYTLVQYKSCIVNRILLATVLKSNHIS